MSVASCLRTHQSCVPMGIFFHAQPPAPPAPADTEAAAAPPSLKTSRRVRFVLGVIACPSGPGGPGSKVQGPGSRSRVQVVQSILRPQGEGRQAAHVRSWRQGFSPAFVIAGSLPRDARQCGMQLNRREFLEALAVTAVAADVRAQSSAELWGGPVLDCHLHLRADAGANVAHMDGCGVARPSFLPAMPTTARERFSAKCPHRIVWAASDRHRDARRQRAVQRKRSRTAPLASAS